MTPGRLSRPDRACPPWCSSGHDELGPSHFGEQRGIYLDSEHNHVIAMAARDDSRAGDRRSFVMVHGTVYRAPGALVRVKPGDADHLAAIVAMLAGATPQQHDELADAIRQAAADIAGARP